MNYVKIDYSLAKEVLPEDAIEKMQYFEVELFNIAAWENDYEPCISSLFMLCSGGSFSDSDPKYGTFFVHNGSLVGTATDSEIYYSAWLNKNKLQDRKGRKPLKDDGFIITFKK